MPDDEEQRFVRFFTIDNSETDPEQPTKRIGVSAMLPLTEEFYQKMLKGDDDDSEDSQELPTQPA